MANQFLPHRTHPIFGFHSQGASHMTIADLPARYSKPIELLAQTAVNTTGAAVALGARGIQLDVNFTTANATCDLEVYKVTSEGDVLVKAFTGLTALVGPLYLGNLERIDLGGLPVKIKILNLQNGSVSVQAVVTS